MEQSDSFTLKENKRCKRKNKKKAIISKGEINEEILQETPFYFNDY